MNFLHRDDFNANHDIETLKKILNERFKMSEFETILLLIDNKYTIENVRQKRSITSYVQIVIRHAKNVDFNTIFTQLN